MRVEIVGTRIRLDGQPRPVPPRLGRLLRLLIASTAGEPETGYHSAVETSRLAELLGWRSGTVSAYVDELRRFVSDDSIVKTAPAAGGYWFDLGVHSVDAFEIRNSVEKWELRAAGQTWSSLTPAMAREIEADLAGVSARWRDNPFRTCEELVAGRSLIQTFDGLRMSLTHLLAMALLAIGDRSSARTARELLERPTYRFRRELATGSEVDLFEADEVVAEDFVAEFPKPEIWALLTVSYYRDDLPARAIALVDALESWYDTERGENLPAVLSELRRRVKTDDPSLSVSASRAHSGATSESGRDGAQGTDPLAITRYLTRVRQLNDRLRFGDPTRQSLNPDEGGPTGRMSLKSVYTPLRVSLNGEGGGDRVREDATTVLDALAQDDYQTVVLLGEPGGGKSTVVSYLATELATVLLDATGDPATLELPVHVRLPDVSPSSDPLVAIWTGVHETFVDPSTDPTPSPDLVRQLSARAEQGRAVFLLDGLDEIAEDRVPAVVSMITQLSRELDGCRYVATCRTYDYGLAEPDRRLPFPSLFLLRFGLREQLEYVDRWYDALADAQTFGRVEERKANLRETLKADERLSQLGEIPLLLTLMALVHTNEGELPRSRSVLYHRAVSYLLAETPQWRRQAEGAALATQDMIAIAARIAHHMHMTEEEVGPSQFRGLTISAIEEVVASFFALDEVADPREYAALRKKIEIHTARLLHSHGLLLDQGGGRFAFAHRSIQEFLAGLFYLNGGDYEEALDVATRTHWREPFLLMAGYGAHQGDALFFIVSLIVELSASGQMGSPERLLIAGEMLAAVGRESLRAKGYNHVLKPAASQAGQAGLWLRLTSELLRVGTDPASDIATRVRALTTVGALGDTRLVDDTGGIRPLTDRVVVLPAGKVSVGRDTSPTASAAKWRTASPERHVDHEPFAAGIFPVTNAEYERFVAANGYREPYLWKSAEGRAWVTGDAGFVEELFAAASSTAERDFGKELDEQVFASVKDLHKEIRRMCAARSEPFYWRNPRFRAPNQPVVGVNWWEAQAYAEWLTADGHAAGWLPTTQVVRVPTEWEWERIARYTNDGRFPWGDDPPSPSRAHTRFDELHLDRATPVGAFPDGASAVGALDLAGNVWEWTLSRNVPFDEAHDANRDDLSGVHERVVRGGSWYATEPATFETSFRGFDYPMNVYFDLGFRVVVQGPLAPDR